MFEAYKLDLAGFGPRWVSLFRVTLEEEVGALLRVAREHCRHASTTEVLGCAIWLNFRGSSTYHPTMQTLLPVLELTLH